MTFLNVSLKKTAKDHKTLGPQPCLERNQTKKFTQVVNELSTSLLLGDPCSPSPHQIVH